MTALANEVSSLKERKKQIRSSGPVAPARVTIDKTTNDSGTVYPRARGDGKTRALGKIGSADHRDWQRRIKRRNAINQVERQIKALNKTRALLEKGIDWDFAELAESVPIQLDQSVYVAPGAAATPTKPEPKLSLVCKRQPSAGGVVHVVDKELGTYNWQAAALCGAKPAAGKSWLLSEWSALNDVSCPKCCKRMG